MTDAPLEKFIRHLENLNRTRKRMETVFRQERIRRRDVESVYEGLYLRAVTGFEAFLREKFFQIVLGKSKHARSRAVPRIAFKSERMLEEVILQNRKYVDWLPYDDTQSRAKLYLRAGRPFTEISQPQRDIINRVVITRHAIAHSSDHATARFLQQVIGTARLAPHDRRPGAFLRLVARTSPSLTNYEIFARELAQAAKDLSK